MSLVARHLEANGIPTVIIGSAMDVVLHCGVPRYLHTDFPLGNPCGKPYDTEMQLKIVQQALGLFGSAREANAVERAAFSWGEDNRWRDAYSRVDDSNRQRLQQLGEERRALQATRKESGDKRAPMISQE